MFRRPLWLTAALAAAAGVPYLALDDRVAQFAAGQYQRIAAPAQPADSPPAAAQLAAASAPLVPLEEALRFDITPQWAHARWPRASGVTADTEHLALRVALVSGTQPTDVAGSLTYYFNQRHELERITLLGVTGDDSRLVAIACRQYGLRPTQTLERGLYYGGDPSEPTSVLRVAHLPVGGNDMSARFEVALDLKRDDVQGPQPWADATGKVLPENYRRW